MSYYVQIYYVQNSIDLANERLNQKKLDLEQLEKALSNLQEIKQDFQHNQRLCAEPEFNRHSWHGQLEDRFDTIRDGQILVRFRELSNHQLGNAIDQIASEIGNVKQEIASLHDENSSLRSRLGYLYELQRRFEESSQR